MVERKYKRRLSLKRQIAFAVIILFSFLSIGEVAIRVWAYYFRTSYERYNTELGRFELVPNINYVTRNGYEFLINSKGYVGPEFDTVPDEGVYRIIALGDSCTFMSGLWKIAYPAILGRLLNSHNTQRNYEVLNAGIEGYNSRFALARIKQELIKYRPQLVTVYIGWNDLMKVNPRNVSVTGRYTFLATLLEESYLVKAYRKLIFVYLRPLVLKPTSVRETNEVGAYDNFVPSTYRANLRSMIETLRQQGIKVLLFTLPTVVRSGMSNGELKRQNVFFPYFAQSYSVERLLSLHQAYNNVIRKVGLKYDVPVVDLDRIFNQQDKTELFWDTMHPSEKGNRMIAESIYNKLQEMELDYANDL